MYLYIDIEWVQFTNESKNKLCILFLYFYNDIKIFPLKKGRQWSFVANEKLFFLIYEYI